MFYCPNCGEPIEDDRAQICPHCGSDDETGWKPDQEYHSVELPEDDYETTEARSSNDRRQFRVLGAIAVVAGVILLAVSGIDSFHSLIALVLIIGGLNGVLHPPSVPTFH